MRLSVLQGHNDCFRKAPSIRRKGPSQGGGRPIKGSNSEPGLDPNSLRSILFQFSKSPIRLSGSIEGGKEYTSGMACLSVSRSQPGSPTHTSGLGNPTRYNEVVFQHLELGLDL